MTGPPDAQVLEALLAMRDGEVPPPPAVGDVAARRRNAGQLFNSMVMNEQPADDASAQIEAGITRAAAQV